MQHLADYDIMIQYDLVWISDERSIFKEGGLNLFYILQKVMMTMMKKNVRLSYLEGRAAGLTGSRAEQW